MAEQVDVDSLLAEKDATIAALQAENDRLYRIVEDETWIEDVFRTKRQVLSDRDKLVLWAYRKLWPMLLHNDAGLGHTQAKDIAAITDIPPDAVLTSLRRFGAMGILKHPKPYREILLHETTGKPILDERTGRPKFTSKLFTAPDTPFEDVPNWTAPPPLIYVRGGKRVKTPIPLCPTCGQPASRGHEELHCVRGHTWTVDTDYEALEAAESQNSQNEVSDLDDELAAIFESQDESKSETSKCSSIRNIEPHFEHSDQEPITRPPASLDWQATLVAWLEKRIGRPDLIHATGEVDSAYKYLPLVGPYWIPAYLEGRAGEIYGSRPRHADGSTWLVCYDFDDDQPEHDAQHVAYMTCLAESGIASFYFPRRPGRGHLEIHFTRPVDPQAAYAWVNSIVPELATVNECYPVHGVEDKRNQPLSWPLWQRIGDEVQECQVEAMSPTEPGHLFACKGVKSDPGRLAELVRRCVTKRVLVPPLKVEETRAYARGLLEKPLPMPAWEDDLIEAFNRSHSWGEIAALAGGFSRTGHFKAVWRCERTASVKPDGPDSPYACDYGNHGNFPKKLDKYGAYCLIMNIDQVAELKKQRAAMREAVSA